MDEKIYKWREMNLAATLPEGVVPTEDLLELIIQAHLVKRKPLSEVEVLALMECPSQAVH